MTMSGFFSYTGIGPGSTGNTGEKALHGIVGSLTTEISYYLGDIILIGLENYDLSALIYICDDMYSHYFTQGFIFHA